MGTNNEVVNFFQKDKEIKDLKLALSELIKRQDNFEAAIQAIYEKINSTQPQAAPAAPQYQYSQPIQTNPFGMIGEFAKAMGQLKAYDNELLNGYRKTIQEVREEIGTPEPAEFDSDAEMLKSVIEIIKNRPPAQQTAPNFEPIPQHTTQPEPTAAQEAAEFRAAQEIKGGASMEYDINKAAEEVPEFIKQGIKSGALPLEQVKPLALEEAKKRGIPATEKNIEELFNKIKGENKNVRKPKKPATKKNKTQRVSTSSTKKT